MKSNWFSGIGSSIGPIFGVGGHCPACIPALGAVFSAVGLGFLVNVTLFKWLTLAFLSIGLLGLYTNARKHQKKKYLAIGILSSTLVFGARYIITSPTTFYTATGVLFINAVLDYHTTKKNSCSCAIKKTQEQLNNRSIIYCCVCVIGICAVFGRVDCLLAQRSQ